MEVALHVMHRSRSATRDAIAQSASFHARHSHHNQAVGGRLRVCAKCVAMRAIILLTHVLVAVRRPPLYLVIHCPETRGGYVSYTIRCGHQRCS